MLDFREVCQHFRITTQGRNSAQAYCPVHKGGREKNASLTISRARNGGTVLYCHYCGKEGTEDILNAVGLKMSDIMPTRRHRGKTLQEFAEWPGRHGEYKGAKFVDSYDYGNESGYCYTKCRASLPDGRGKTFRYCRTDAERCVIEFNVKDRPGYAALYPYKSLLTARKTSGMVLYVEGEKDAKNASADGFPAVTAGSANDWTNALPRHFEGLQVIVVPDRDEKGYKSAEVIVDDLHGHGVQVKVISWPESFTVEKGDYSDFIETFPDRSAGIAAFQELIDSAISPDEFKEFLEEYQAVAQKEERQEVEQTTEDEVRTIAIKIGEAEGGKVFPVTDLKCGELIGQLFEDSRYNTTAKSWYWYDGKRWTIDTEGMHIEHAAAVFADALYYYSMFFMDKDIAPNELTEFRYSCGSLSRRSRRVAAIQDARKVRSFSSEELDADTALFNCQNGVLNLDTFEFMAHKPEFLLSKIAGCDYAPNVSKTDFLDFVNQIMQGDETKIRFLQTYCGYAMTGRPVQECFLIFYGPLTRNGKTTFVDTMAAAFGDYAVTLEPESLIQKRFPNGSGPNDDIARLAGERLAISSEVPKNMKIDESLLKKLTGNNVLRARHLNERFFDFRAQFSIIMDANFLPTVTDTTLFTSGRVMVLPFERHFDEAEQDKGLKLRLQEPENLSAALNWMLEGLRRYQSEGLRRPESVISATSDYADDSDKIKRFVNEELEEKPGNNLKASDVYERFVSWCRRSGIGSESKGNFFQLLRSRGLIQKTGTVNGATVKNVVIGYRFPEWHQVNDYDDEVSDEWR